MARRVDDAPRPRVPITLGQLSMALGLFGLFGLAGVAHVAHVASVPALIALMMPVGAGAGMAMPSATSLLLNTVPDARTGTASGVLNTSRQVGGATAIAAFGALMASLGPLPGARLSMAIAALLLSLSAAASLRLGTRRPMKGSTS